MDKRKYNGGARVGTGPKPLDDQEKKVTLIFYVKRKHLSLARSKLQPVIDKLNAK